MEKKLTITITDESGRVVGDMEITDFTDIHSRVDEAVELVEETIEWKGGRK